MFWGNHKLAELLGSCGRGSHCYGFWLLIVTASSNVTNLEIAVSTMAIN